MIRGHFTADQGYEASGAKLRTFLRVLLQGRTALSLHCHTHIPSTKNTHPEAVLGLALRIIETLTNEDAPAWSELGRTLLYRRHARVICSASIYALLEFRSHGFGPGSVYAIPKTCPSRRSGQAVIVVTIE